jgi:pimeloyl-ACP methyl ester carboxylesterase
MSAEIQYARSGRLVASSRSTSAGPASPIRSPTTDYPDSSSGFLDLDVCDLVSSIEVPTLILHPSHDHVANVRSGRWLAEHIAGARLIEIRAWIVPRSRATSTPSRT